MDIETWNENIGEYLYLTKKIKWKTAASRLSIY
jgi:hypothetical protein